MNNWQVVVITFLISFSAKALSTFTVQVKKPNHSIVFRNKKNIHEFRPNASLHWGVKYSADSFYIEYGGKIKDTNYGNSDVGNNSYKSLRVGLSFSNFFIGLYHQEWKGFSSDERDEASCEYCLERENLSSRESSVNLLYAFDSNFSMRALNSDGSRGVNQASSWLLIAFYDRFRVHDNQTLILEDPQNNFEFFDDLHTIEAEQYGVGFGYGLVYPFGPLYFALSASVGIGYQKAKLIDEARSRNEYIVNPSHWSLKVNLGTKGKGLNIGVKGYLFSNIYKIGESQNVGNVNYSLYSYLSYSF